MFLALQIILCPETKIDLQDRFKKKTDNLHYVNISVPMKPGTVDQILRDVCIIIISSP